MQAVFLNRMTTIIALASLTMIGVCQATCSPCPFQWVEHRNHCYRYFPVPLSYDEAEAFCQHNATSGKTSGLALVSSLEEAIALIDYVVSIISQPCTLDAAPEQIWLGKKAEVSYDDFNKIYHHTLSTAVETNSHFTSCSAYDSPVAISKSEIGTGVSKMVPSPDVVEQKCSIYTGEGAFIDLGDFAGTCVSDPDVCTSESVTWSLWLKINSSVGFRSDITSFISVGGYTSRARGFDFNFKASSQAPFWFSVRSQRKPSVVLQYSTAKIPMDRWFHLAVAVDMTSTSAQVNVYVDNMKLAVDSQKSPGTLTNDGCTRLVLGNLSPCVGSQTPSSLDKGGSAAYSNLMVFDHLLTEEQIANLYACGSLDWDLKIRSLDIDTADQHQRSLRFVCTASASTGPTISWSVYHREQAQWQELDQHSTEEGFEITPTNFSRCVVQSALVIDQAQGPLTDGDIIACTANTGSRNSSVYIHQGRNATVGLYSSNGEAGLFVANAGQDYYGSFNGSGEGRHPFICKKPRRYI